jgi:formylglycine-generating enzyme required for sulfatase activity
VIAAVVGGFAANASAVTIDWVTVGNAGNAADPLNSGTIPGIGAVGYEYRISKHEVTNAQYTEFLNAVDPTGANALGLFKNNMAGFLGGIVLQAGNADGSNYVAKDGRENNPVNWVSWLDSARFTNWLHSGQPSGGGGTETGAYTINNGLTETRAPGANYFLPSEDEWYKAAYHDASVGMAGHYFLYATGSNSEPISDQPGVHRDDNRAAANYFNDDGLANGYNDGYAVSGSTSPISTNPFTDVGAYTDAASPYGTFDQNGNVWEWNETQVTSSSRGARGASAVEFALDASNLRSSLRNDIVPTIEAVSVGFRVASPVGAPSPASLLNVDYDTPDVLGPISFGLTELPAAPSATFTLGEGNPAGGGATGYGLADVTTANMIFGNGIFTTLTAFDMEVAADGSLEALSFTFAPLDTLSVSGGGIVMNSPLYISGTDIASGQAFSYTYANSTETLTNIPEPATMTLLEFGALMLARRRKA